VPNQLPERALDVALAASAAAREIVLGRFHGAFSVDFKADRSEVTEADREAELAIRQLIQNEFPDHQIAGEEFGGGWPLPGWSWLVDPIDGTTSFVHRLPLFATLIALCLDGQPRLGVLELPALGRRLYATAGGGAWEGSRPLALNPDFDPEVDVVCLGDRRQFASSGRMALFDSVLELSRLPRTYPDAFGYALVAGGSAALMVDPDLQPWDLMAPTLIVQEAGGVVRTEPEANGKTFVLAGSPAAVAWAERLMARSPEHR